MLAVFFAGAIGIVGLFAWVAKDLPDPNNLASRQVAQTTRIYDRTGTTVLYEVYGDVKRTIVTLDKISPDLQHAVLAIEDRYFYEHKGFRITSIIRAFISNLLHRNTSQGGSTITQQFIKNSVLTREKKYIRKIKEAILAVELEHGFTKDQILGMYLNDSPFGSSIYGVETAALSFFGKTAAEITPAEAALMASVLQAPTYYSPYGSHTDKLIERQHVVLDQMVEQGYLTGDAAEEAKKINILATVKQRREPIIAPHFVFYVRELLADKFGEDDLDMGGLRVITTLDLDKQKFAEDAIAKNADVLKKHGANTAAVLSLDPKTGEVLAMVGSADYFNNEINGRVNALLTRLQPGSSIKPMVYASAFEKGYTPDTVLYDVETTFKNYPSDYVPHDYDLKERGPMTVRESLAGSLNIPAVAMLYLTGIDGFIDFARRLGYTTYENRSSVGLSLVLGGADIRPIEHIAAFSAFAQDGNLPQTIALLRVEDSQGKIIYDARQDAPPVKRVLEPEIARQINSILSDNAARAYVFGEKNYLTLPDRPAAVKTGTTNSYKDAWTIGYTPSLVTGVWVGIQQGGKMKAGADGSKVAAPIWNQFMRDALKGTQAEQFTAPQPVVTGKPVLDGDKTARVRVKVDKISGKLATDMTPPELVEERAYGVPHSILFFVDRNDPRGAAPEHPEADPQYESFEAAVNKWATDQQISGSTPPTEKDDIHVPENVPTVTVVHPADGATVNDRALTPVVNASARLGIAKYDYLIDGEQVGTASPYGGSSIQLPNRFTKGFHRLTVRAFDPVGNRADATVTFNLTAEAGPIGAHWISPAEWQSLYVSGSFPCTLKYSLDDPKSIRTLVIKAINQTDQSEQIIGSTDSPSMSNQMAEWKNPPGVGNYVLRLEATLVSGEQRSESRPITIMQ